MSKENLKNSIEDEETTEIQEVDLSETDENSAQDEKTSPRQKFLIIGGIVAACFLLIVGYLYLERGKTVDTNTNNTEPEKIVSVKVAKAEKETIAKEYTAVGTVTPAEQSTVAASISAQITNMPLLKNQFVQKGEVLATLASQDLQSQKNEAVSALEEAKLNLQTLQKVTIPQNKAQTEKELADAKANADNARAIYERRKDLYEKNGLSLKELEASQLALNNAENSLKLANKNANLNTSAVNPNARAIAESKIKQAQDRVNSIDVQKNQAQIRAPISGIITDQFQFQGEYATAGGKLLTIANIGSVIIKANFADTVVADLQTSDAVSIIAPNAPDERIGGKITQISPTADTQNRTIEVWANFANGRGLLKTGDAVQFVVSANPTNDAVVVPESAVTLDAANSDEGIVMTVDAENIAHETKVKVGVKSNGKYQIVEGLSSGETVVTEGNYSLPDGTKVEIGGSADGSSANERSDVKFAVRHAFYRNNTSFALRALTCGRAVRAPII